MAKYKVKSKKEKQKNSSESFLTNFLSKKSKMGIPNFILDNGIVCIEKPQTEYSLYLHPENIDIDNLKQSERAILFENFWDFHKKYPHSIKERFLSFVEKNKEQQSFIEYKLSKETHLKKIEWLREELYQLKYLEQEYKSYQSSFVIFAPTIDELENRYAHFVEAISPVMKITPFTTKETITMLRMVSNVSEQYIPDFNPSDLIGEENSVSFQNFIKPQGGMAIKDESYIKFGDGVRTTLNIVSRAHEVDWYWVKNLARIEGVNSTLIDYYCDTSIDYAETTGNSSEFKNFEKKNARKHNQAATSDTQEQLLVNANHMIREKGEQIKYVSIRLFVSADTVDELESKIVEIKRKIKAKKFEAEILLNLQEDEFKSQFISYESQLMIGSKRNSNVEMPCEAIRKGFGHNRIEIKDPNGFFAGITSTGGTFYFDNFRKTSSRNAYDMFISGKKGAGKSTILKKTAKHNFAIGNRVFVFDKAREWQPLAKEAGGITYSLDGSNGMINMLQVFPLKTKDVEGNTIVDVAQSFNYHTEQTAKRLRIFSSSVSDENEETFSDILYDFYVELGLYDSENSQLPDITSLPNHLYPTFVELQAFVKHKLEQGEFEKEIFKESYDKMDTIINKIMKKYKEMFVGTTSFVDLIDQSFVVFDISMLSHDKTTVYDCLYDLVLNLTISTLMKTGREEFLAYNRKLKDSRDIVRSLIINDECHNTLNLIKPAIIESFASLSSEGRKSFIGTVHATQEIHEMFPAGANIDNSVGVKSVTNMKKILGLVDYLWLLKQSSTSIPIIKEYFGTYFVESDYEDMERFETDQRGAQLKLIMSGSRPLDIWFRVKQSELDLFGGGA